MQADIRIADNPESLAENAAELFLEVGLLSLAERGRFSVSLSGGSTPKMLYSLLASPQFSSRIEWERVYFFFGDERNVDKTDERSNFRMANEALFRPLEISPANIFRWETELNDPARTALEYERAISSFFGGPSHFDLFLLGLGLDGHTASLFPDTAALSETSRAAIENFVDKLGEYRFTMTFSEINRSRNVVFIAAGSGKAAIVSSILEKGTGGASLPACRVAPETGRLVWLLDRAAAADLTHV